MQALVVDIWREERANFSDFGYANLVIFGTIAHDVVAAGDPIVTAPEVDLSYLESDDPFPLAWREKLAPLARAVQAQKGQIVIAQGAASNDVYLIESGRVQFSILAKSGRETIFGELGPGHLFGELSAIDAQPRSVSATCIERCDFLQIRGEDFQTFLCETPRAGFWMAQKLAARSRFLTERAFELATMSVSGRLQIELLRLSLKNGVENDVAIIEAMPTHSALAARIGTHREAVTRELGLLSDEGIAKQSGRRLTILSVRKLQELFSRTQ